MKSNNLSICIPNKGCERNCQYCVSKMTFAPECNYQLMRRNSKKVLEVARAASVTSVLLTSKGEPFMNFFEMIGMLEKFNMYPIEVQTNGYALLNDMSNLLPTLSEKLLNTIAISVDKNVDLESSLKIARNVYSHKMTIRVCVNVQSEWPEVDSIGKILLSCEESNVQQVIFRRISIPKTTVYNERSLMAIDWIKKHDSTDNYKSIYNYVSSNGVQLRKTIDGSVIFGINNISVLLSDYCVQSSNNDNDIRSLIFHQDGHLYTSWDHPGSILF